MTTYSAVVTTGIYCRPGCRARPRAENVRTFELAASAEAAGFRACLRCRPYRTAGPLGADAPELVCRAVRLIIDGVLDTGTEAALGATLAVSPRHLRRIFHDHLGITPDQPPIDWDTMAAFFASRAVPGVESVSGGVYRRTISLDGAPGLLEIRPGGADHLLLRAHLPYWEGLIHVAGRAARMAGTDARPDVRVPGAWGSFEAAVQAVVAQECDDPGRVRAQLGRIAERFGPPVPGLTHELSRLFPSAEVLAAAVAGIQPATASQLALRLGHQP